MQDLQDHIRKAWSSKMPFVAYHLPDANEVRCFFPQDSYLHHLQSYNEAGFIFSPFEVSSQSILFSEKSSKVLKFELIDYEIESKSKFKIEENLEDKSDYLKLLTSAIDEIQSEEMRKIVVSRKLTSDYDLESPSELLLKLIRFYPDAFTYVWFHPEIGLWAGASPEILAETHRTQFKTMALAGTKREDENREWSEKELDEQQIVTDEIVNGLKKYTQNLEISERKTDAAGELLHLRTDIKAFIDTEKLGDVIKEIHPTPAVCGLPRDKAYKFLQTHENYDRSFYTGFFGELNMPKHQQRSSRKRNQENQAYKSIVRTSSLYVNLRCLSYDQGKVNIYVGGGITKDSIPEEEWQETVNKSMTMLKVL